MLRDGQRRQSDVAIGIQSAIDFLDKWSSYQEVIRITREIMEATIRATDQVKGGKK